VSILEGGRFMGQHQFMPMLPGDDQIVPYDQDTSVSIVRSFPQELQSHTVERVEPLREGEVPSSKRKRLVGACLVHKKVMTTRYTLRNNATDRTVDKFYVDHSAMTNHGGFVITTTDKAVKAVTGFSRYECSLSPLEEEVMDVAEEVTYKKRFTSFHEIAAFLKAADTKDLLQSETLSESLHAELQACVEREELATVYRKLESQREVSEKELADWCGRALLPETVLELLAEGAKVADRLREVARQTATHQAHVQKVFTNQERLRSNIKSLEKVQSSTLVDRYLTDLNNQEDDLIATNAAMDELAEEKSDLDAKTKELHATCAVEAAKLREAMVEGSYSHGQ